MRPTFIFIILSAGLCFPVTAQQLSPSVLSPAGDVDRNDRIELAWTIGEVAVERRTGQPESITEGFHQPTIEVEVLASDLPATSMQIQQISVAPNPVMHTLQVVFDKPTSTKWQLSLTDALGRHLSAHQHPASELQSTVDVSQLPPGIYYLQLQREDPHQLITYKISKIQ